MLYLTEAFSPASTGPVAVLGLLLLGSIYYFLQNSLSHPLVNGKQTLEFRNTQVQQRFLSNARSLIKEGVAKWPAFNIATVNGHRLVLSTKYINEIRSHELLDFNKAIAHDFHPEVHGFEPFRQGLDGRDIVQDAVRMKLTQSLGHVTKPLSEETSLALQKNWTDNYEWHTIPLKTTILDIVAQLSSKVFLGDQICRNPDWLRITVAYTVDSFQAAEALRFWPKFMRPMIASYLPATRKVQAELQEACDIITPVLEKRRKEKQAALDRGETPARYNDAMEWMETCAKGRPYDAAAAQLSFSLAAIHTTSDMLTQVLYDIHSHEGLADALRKEVLDVVQSEGWQKTTLYKLKLMDSVLKESQRMKPVSFVSMSRKAEKTFKLSDGTTIPKNSIVCVPAERQWDESVYSSPLEFDPYRFLKLREQSGHETSAQLVSPSPEHLGFGFGKHACPGRFFAANELKIALCHILLKYDFRLPEGASEPKPIVRGFGMIAEPRANMEIRRREPEIEL
ncbi:cytochrome P450 [Aspergillus undulatus]|uniref:cytochrome P450 n=1 Tax=Aspergillus undulatus TaxID=1810928 RepID=UPI003CCDEF40